MNSHYIRVVTKPCNMKLVKVLKNDTSKHKSDLKSLRATVSIFFYNRYFPRVPVKYFNIL